MDFFRSILADDPEPETPDNYDESDTDPRQSQSPKHETTEGDEDDDSNSNLNSSEDGSAGGGGGLWSFGDLVKTLTTRSESVFETYRRDLKGFGTGLRKESDLFREVASRAVKELPTSIEVGTSAIDGVLKSTADIISQGKEALLAVSSDIDESDASERHAYYSRHHHRRGLDSNSRRYSRFEAQLNSIQNDSRTFCENPDDLEDYYQWKLAFVFGEKRDEIEALVGDNGALAGIYTKLVPSEVDDATFWYRYFYKVHKLKLQEDMRAKLVKRSLSMDVEEELSWDVDDDDEEEEEEDDQKEKHQQKEKQHEADQVNLNASKCETLQNVGKKESRDDEFISPCSKTINEEDKKMITNVEEPKPSGGNVSTDEKVDSSKVKDKEASFHEEEDLEWDEIEDLGNNEDKKVDHGVTTNKDDLRKRFSTAVDEEDLSWDIEDEDNDDVEHVKTGNK